MKEVVIDCLVEAGDWPDEAELRALAAAAVDAALAEARPSGPAAELSLVFTDDAHVARLNETWRGRAAPTNVLSFPAVSGLPGEEAGPMLGDIVVALETVRREASLENKPFNSHLTHMIVHGFLHLLGYDHQTDTEGSRMEALERRILGRLAIPDPYEETLHCD